MQNRAFTDCTLPYLSKTFGLHRLLQSADLDDWLNRPVELSEHETESLHDLQQQLRFNILGWNEQELSMQFIGPLFSLTRFSNERFNLFAGRYMEAVIPIANDEVKLLGKPDGIIATGYFEPEKPFFCFHEYKKELDNSGDPLGQVMGAMIAGQVLNQQSQLIYGCYVVGRIWSFVTLRDKNYCMSQAFDATTDDIFVIFRILQSLKIIITGLTQNG